MSAWGGGYVTDFEYITGFYRQQSPPNIALAALLGGVDSRLPTGADHAHYMELGCGHGMNAVLVAASNPAWRVTAIDFNPAHIAAGIALAQAAALTNVTFLEADFGQLVGSPQAADIPAADVVSLHGVWSWVSPAVRAGIVRLLASKVAPGGLVHVSYNALPAWQGAVGMRRLVYEAGRRRGGRSDRQVGAGMEFAREMLGAEARHFHTDGFTAKLLERQDNAAIGYLTHEYMNEHWSPCFHADVAAAMGDAKLDWAGSANPLENFPDLMLSAEQRALLDRYDDPVMRELIKDTCLPRQLRHDVYVRGARRLSSAARDAGLAHLTVALTVPAAKFDFEIDVPAGKAELGPAFRPMVAALDDGLSQVGALLALTPGRSNPAELAATLVATNQGMIVANPGVPQPAAADRLNRVLGRRVTSITSPETSQALASGMAGSALPVPRLVQFVCARMLDGEDEGAMERWFETLSADVPADKHEKLRGIIGEVVEQQVPVLRRLGVLPG